MKMNSTILGNWRSVNSCLVLIVVHVHVLVLVLVLVLVGCTNNLQQQEQGIIGVIKQADLNDNERNLLTAIGAEKVFVFDYIFNHNEDNLMIEYWVEYYANGNYQDNVISANTKIEKKEEGRVFLTIHKTKEDEEKWVISTQNDKGNNNSFYKIIEQPKEGVGETWKGASFSKNINVANPIILAVVTGNTRKGISGIKEEVFDHNQQAIEELLKNDYVYIVKMKVMNNK